MRTVRTACRRVPGTGWDSVKSRVKCHLLGPSVLHGHMPQMPLQAVTWPQEDPVCPFCTQHGRLCRDRGGGWGGASHMYWTLGGARWALRQQGGPSPPATSLRKEGTARALPAVASITPWSEEFNWYV